MEIVIKNVTETRTLVVVAPGACSPRVHPQKGWAGEAVSRLANLNFGEIEMPLAYLSIYFGDGQRGGKSIMNKLPQAAVAALRVSGG